MATGSAQHPLAAPRAPVAAAWICLLVTWFLFLLPFPGPGLAGWVLDLAVCILAIVVLVRGRIGHGLVLFLGALLVSPLLYVLGWVLMLIAAVLG